MRRSAISCWCSLLAANAGEDAARRMPATSAPRILCVIGSLRGDDEMRAPVLGERRFVVAWIERELLAVADGSQPIGGDAEGHEVGARGDRPALAQRQIVLGGPALIAVPFDRYGPAGIAFQ